MSGWIPRLLTALSSGSATADQVPVADGSGGITWDTQSGGGGGIAGESAKATRSSTTQSIPNSTVTAIQFDTETWDDNGLIDLGANNTRITIQTAGRYLITAGMRFAADTSASRSIQIRTNGTTQLVASEGSSLSAGHKAAAVIAQLSASDYVEALVFQNTGASLNLEADVRNHLAVVRLGSLLGSGNELTIASGVITITQGFHTVATQSDASTDDLDTINGGVAGQLLVLQAANAARDVVVKDGTGNLRLNGDFTLDHTNDTITLIYAGTNWLEVARSDNAT